mgnify:CR=1 FL=1
MRLILATAALVMLPLTGGHAGDVTTTNSPNGYTIGHDGKMWRMEGCAAYPVTAETGAQSKPVATATAKPTKDPLKLALRKLGKSE